MIQDFIFKNFSVNILLSVEKSTVTLLMQPKHAPDSKNIKTTDRWRILIILL